ncbi:hypothetical protein CQW23_21473 [Capsicum baccatum]|uniref:Uncharacterized protein n=1 Tax=Capsicum baccatum TaxID=33114 RepID=A0A2G2VY39_CAPBA|nr:hypothetical protein CQW23_21473 [Capsicum baccatum]
MQAIANALCGQESENSQEALRVLDIILRNNGNSISGGHESPNETDRMRLCRPYQSKKIQVGSSSMSTTNDSLSDLLLFARVFEAEFTSFSATES